MRVGDDRCAVDLGYPYKHIGNTPPAIADLHRGKHEFAAILKNAKKADAHSGAGALARADGAAHPQRPCANWPNNSTSIKQDWNGFNVLQLAAARVGGLDLGFLPQPAAWAPRPFSMPRKREMSLVYLLGADEIDMKNLGNAFVIYQGHHGDNGRASRRCDFAGRGLYRKIAHLRQYRRPPANGAAGGVSAGRSARGLEDHSRVFRSDRQASAFRHADATARERCRSVPVLGAYGADREIRVEGIRQRGRGFGQTLHARDREFLYDRPDQPRLGDDGKMHGGNSPLSDAGGGGINHERSLRSPHALSPLIRIVLKIVAIIVPLLVAVAYLTYAERKVMAAMQLRSGPNVVGPLGLAAAGCRRHQIAGQGNDHSHAARTSVLFLLAPMLTFFLALVGLGGDSVSGGRRAGQYQCRHFVSVRDFVAERLWHHRCRLGVEFEIFVSRRVAFGGADGFV